MPNDICNFYKLYKFESFHFKCSQYVKLVTVYYCIKYTSEL